MRRVCAAVITAVFNGVHLKGASCSGNLDSTRSDINTIFRIIGGRAVAPESMAHLEDLVPG